LFTAASDLQRVIGPPRNQDGVTAAAKDMQPTALLDHRRLMNRATHLGT
jgi:hypothetical protein